MIIPKVVPKNKIVLMIFFFGANDACINGALQHVPLPIHSSPQVPLETYASNLRELLSCPLLKEHNPNIKLLLITPPPICAYRWGDHDLEMGFPPRRNAEHTALYAAKAKAVAEELGIPYVDLWRGFLHAAGWK